jgi:carbon storage regulator CsrA
VLVLSRRVHEKVLFPNFRAAVEVLGVKGTTVRLGIQAPPEVTVLREEIPDRLAEWGPPAAPETPTGCERLVELVSNRLRVADVGLEALRSQIRAGLSEEALTVVERLAEDLQLLRRRLAEEARKAPPRPAPAAPRPRKALLVEDNANERELLAQFLRLGGFEVDTAGDGADALDYLRARGKPDVVLMDMSMPRCDGPTTVRTIRGDHALAGLRIVGVSGSTPEQCGLDRGPGGIDRWFCKPVDPNALIQDLEHDLTAHVTRRA